MRKQEHKKFTALGDEILVSIQELGGLYALPLTSQEEVLQEHAQPFINKGYEKDNVNLDSPNKSSVPQTDQSNRNIFLVAKGSGIVISGNLFFQGSQFLIGIILTRLLGAAQFGMYKIAITTGEMAAGFALLGMEYAMVRFVSLYASRRDTSRLWGTLQVGMGLTMLASLLIGAGMYGLATPLAVYLFHDPQIESLLRLASLIVPFLVLSLVLASATRGFNKMQYAVFAQQIAQPLVRLIPLVPLAIIGLTAGKAIILYIIGLVVTVSLLLYFLNYLFPLRRPLQTARRETGKLLRFSLPAYLSSLLDSFGPSFRLILLGSISTIATAGIFAVATQVGMVVSIFNNSIGTASSPIISELYGQGDRGRMAHFYQITTKWMVAVNLPLFLIVLLLAKPILMIFGEEFLEGTTALIILAFANLVTATAGVSDGVLAMTGNTMTKLFNSAVQTILTIGLSFLLILHWGVIGAALATLITIIVLNLLRVLEVFVMFRIFPYNLNILKPIFAGGGGLAIGWLIRQLFHTESSLVLATINALAILVSYVGIFILLGFSPEDLAVLASLWKRVVTIFSRD